MQEQAHGYFELPGIGNVTNNIPRLLIISPQINLSDGYETQETEIQNLYNRVRSCMIAK